jgi:RNA polymerase-binding transcription factor DksA
MTDSRRSSLLARRDDTSALLATLEREFDAMLAASEASNADDEHDPEGATIAFERAQLNASIADLRRQIGQIDAALVRIDEGSFGLCTVCGMPIAAARLAVRPEATTCVNHASG